MKRAGSLGLDRWVQAPHRRPLVIRGARQVGKTWLVESFARERFGHVAKLDFERDPRAETLFEDPSPKANLRAIEAFLGSPLQPDRTVLFLDEVQAAPSVLARLRYFHEEIPELPVIAAGSLLDFTLADPDFSMPVGRIGYLHLEPMSFAEFLDATSDGLLLDFVRQWNPGDAVPGALHHKLLSSVRDYTIVGGMPAAVRSYRESQSWIDVAELQQDLLATYRDDFNKYGSRASVPRLLKLLDAIPQQVGQKFVFRRVDRDDRSAPLRNALDLLGKARVCHRVACSHGNGVPLAAETNDKVFKVVFLDSGLLLAALGLRPEQMPTIQDLTLVNAGAVAEQLVGQMLRTLSPTYIEPALFYWQRDRPGSEAEVDYLIQHAGRVIPIEVKAGKAGSLRSLHLFMKEKQLDLAVRVHGHDPELREINTAVPGQGQVHYRLLSVPFYLVSELPRLLDMLG